MLKNYLTVALRSLRKRIGYTFINIFGLGLGIACCLLILSWVRTELRYDGHHEHAERLARLTRETSVLSAAPMGPAMVREMPGVEAAARILAESGVLVERADGEQFEETIYLADSTLFTLFDFVFLRGDAAALRQPGAIVLTETTARKYFGDADPVGRSLTLHEGEPSLLTVTGVVEDLPATSHLQFDMVGSFEQVARQSSRMANWSTNWLYTYLLLREGTTATQVEAQLPALFERHTEEAWDHFRVQPLRDIHLRSAHLQYDIAPQGNIAYVYLFSAVALLILLVACVNFMNLATAHALGRAGEVGVRKMLGAQRRQLIVQFLSEAMLLAILALALAVGLVLLLLPMFQRLSGQALALTDSGTTLMLLLGLTLVVGLIAGSYPAFFLSAFQPVDTLKGLVQQRDGGWLRKALVVFQFTVSIFLIAGTLAIHRQLDYVQNARLGFDKEQTLVIDFGETLGDRYEVVKREVLQHPNVRAVSAAANVPGQGVSDFYYRPEGWTDDDDLPGWDTYFVDPDYLEVLAMEVAQGRGFSAELASDTSGFLLNETAHAAVLARLGAEWRDPVGKQLDFYVPGAEGWEVLRSGPVLGVVEDFHYRSLHAEIGPLVMQVVPPTFEYLLVKVGPDDLAGTLDLLETQWHALGADRAFDYAFLDASYESLYRAEQQVGTLFGAFAVLAIFIACLGLFGLAALTAAQRTKELGVRKVLGASVPGLIGLVVRDFAVLVGIAIVVASPLAWAGMNHWLDGFAYRADLGGWLFVGAGLITLAIALLTVSYHALRAATADPVHALRYE